MHTVPSRYASKILITDNGCWEWQASRDSNGYGRVGFRGRVCAAHRVLYELLIGPIPNGLQLDHLCRNRPCVNPAHLEPVTVRVNILRGQSPAAEAARRDTCAQGHPYTAETMFVEEYDSTRRGWKKGRRCRICKRENDAAYRQRRREARASRAA